MPHAGPVVGVVGLGDGEGEGLVDQEIGTDDLEPVRKLENVGRSTAEYMRWRELMNATVTRTTAAPADSARSSMAANWEAPARTSGDDSQATNRSRPDSAITTPRTKPNGIPGTASGTMSRKPAQKACRSNEKSAIAGTLRGWEPDASASRIGDDLAMETFSRWSIAAVNLPEHADNPVHTVEGGLAAGTTVPLSPAPRCSPISPVRSRQRGDERVVGGGYEVWFRGPVLADERVVVAGGPTRSWRRSVIACARLVPEAR